MAQMTVEEATEFITNWLKSFGRPALIRTLARRGGLVSIRLRNDLDDIFQEVCIRFLKYIPGKDIDNHSAYARIVLDNVVSDFFDRRYLSLIGDATILPNEERPVGDDDPSNEAGKIVDQLLEAYPGAEADVIKVFLDVDDYDIAARRLLAAEGRADPSPKEIKSKKKLVRVYKSRWTNIVRKAVSRVEENWQQYEADAQLRATVAKKVEMLLSDQPSELEAKAR